MNPQHPSRIAIIGVGQVGAAAANALILGSVASELLLVDRKTDLRNAQVHDLSDVTYSCNNGVRVRAATYEEAGQSDIVVITAGSKYSFGETSMQHMYQNIGIMRSVINSMKPFRSDTILLVVANPVDLLTSLAHGWSGLPSCQVIGSGTFPDSVRLRGLVAERVGIAASSIDLYALGIHGPSQVIAWSTATIAGMPIDKALAHGLDYAQLADECKHRSQTIIQAKGATPLGIAKIVTSICSSILRDRRDVRPVSYFDHGYGCCYSMLVVLGRSGVVNTLPMPLNDDEEACLAESVKSLRDTLDRIDIS